MTQEEMIAYVRATATLLALPLDDARAQRVAEHLVHTATLAQRLEAAPLGEEDEVAEIYCPAPFKPSHSLDS